MIYFIEILIIFFKLKLVFSNKEIILYKYQINLNSHISSLTIVPESIKRRGIINSRRS